MAKSQTRDVLVDNRFYLPPGIVDARQESRFAGEVNYSPDEIMIEGPTLPTPDSTVPLPPTSFTLVSQTVRLGSDGRSVVDVVFEFPDIAGIEFITPRVTKL